MASWFLGSDSFADRVEKATSESIPAGHEDIAAYLEIADNIKGKQQGLTAEKAMRTLKNRLRHQNPHVQLMTLKLIDICVKNGGPQFVAQICSREFLDNMESMLTSPPMFGGVANHDVRQKMLSLIQNWAFAVRDRPDCSYALEIFNRMRNNPMYVFPPVDSSEVLPSMVDTKTAPEWSDSSTCERCRTAFTFTNRKHHCRNCGKTFCQPCSAKSTPLPQFGLTEPVRVCEGCYSRIMANLPVPPAFVPPGVVGSVPAMSAPATELAKREEEELQRAIQLSLAESGQKVAVQPVQQPVRVQATDLQRKEEEDLERAIQESLKDLQKLQTTEQPRYQEPIRQEARQEFNYPSTSTSSHQPTTSPRFQAPLPNPHAISETEKSNIRMFSELVDRLDSEVQAGQNVQERLGDQTLQNLYSQIAPYQTKLVRELETNMSKYRSFVELNARLEGAMKTYDLMLQRRLMEAASYSTLPKTNGEYSGYSYEQDQGYYNQSYNVAPQPAVEYHQPPVEYHQPTVEYQYPPQEYHGYYDSVPVSAPPQPVVSQASVYPSVYESTPVMEPVKQESRVKVDPQEAYILATQAALNNAPSVPNQPLPTVEKVEEKEEKPLIEL